MSKAKVHFNEKANGLGWPECFSEDQKTRFHTVTTDPSAVTCLRCRETKAFREAVGRSMQNATLRAINSDADHASCIAGPR